MEPGIVRRMEDGAIPFSDETFDIVVSNQAMEHVPDLDFSLSEVDRVLAPGGLVLGLLLDKGGVERRTLRRPIYALVSQGQ